MPGDLILLMEDNPLNPKLVRDVLHVVGYDTLESTTAEAGLTAAAIAEDRDRLLEAGFDGSLAKPIDIWAVLEEVRQYCGPRGSPG
jgi:CheY-like chemotaxis protein